MIHLAYYEVLLDEDYTEEERLIIKLNNELNKILRELEAAKATEENLMYRRLLEKMENKETGRDDKLHGSLR